MAYFIKSILVEQLHKLAPVAHEAVDNALVAGVIGLSPSSLCGARLDILRLQQTLDALILVLAAETLGPDGLTEGAAILDAHGVDDE